MKTFFTSLIFTFIIIATISAQNNTEKLNGIFKGKTEIQFKFQIKSKVEIPKLTRIISIDNVKDNEVWAYANKNEFSKFMKLGYLYQIIDNNDTTDLNMLDNIHTKSIQAWNFYPTYAAYDSLMTKFQQNYPNLCRTFSIKTLNSGRKILFVKISDHPDSTENEPKFLYTSSMHGDELTGYVLMLHLIDYLLSNYGTDQRITNLVNNTEIWINPLANPDGAYAGGNSTVANATRENANGIDFNRNFPDPQAGQHPDGNAWQPETMAFMALADSIPFTMSANFHGGSEVVNYPWDTWDSLSHKHADQVWWNYVGREYADTAHINSYSGYFTGPNTGDNGVTNGYAWYQITGGRQDYMNYYKHCREFTLEISNTKKPSASNLPNYWNYNYRSILNYLEQCQYGIRGFVTDSITGTPLKAKIFIQGHDLDSSHVYTMLPLGNYFRPIYEGTYNVTYSATGYYSKTINVNAINKNYVTKNVQLAPITNSIDQTENYSNIHIYPNPAHQKINISIAHKNCYSNLVIKDIYGKTIFAKQVNAFEDQIEINVSGFAKGLYFIVLQGDNNKITKKIIIE